MTQENLSSHPSSLQELAASHRLDAVPRRSATIRYALGVLTALLLAGAVVGAYAKVFDCGFVNYDDDQYVYDNSHVQAGLTRDGVWWALTSTDTVNWYPLTWMSLELDSSLWGGVGKAFGFHLTNLLLHIADTLLLFWVLTRMTGRMGRSAFVAGLFALHPLHVESVAWVTERKDVLSALFWMLALAAYVWYAERPHWARYLLVVLAFALGLTAKSMLVTLPCVLLLLDFWPLRRYPGLALRDADGDEPAPTFRFARASWRRLIVEKIPLFVLAAASTAITMYAQQKGGESNSLSEMPLRVGNALVCYVAYLGKTIWPVGLVPYYPFPKAIRGGHVSLFESDMALVLLLAVTVAVLAAARRRPYLAVGWFWFVGTLAPVIGVIQVIGDYAMADRFTYIPLIGLFIAVAWGGADGLARMGVRPRFSAAAAAALLLVLGVGTWRQVGYWHDSLTLWDHTLDVNPRNHLAYNNIGHFFFQRGKNAKAEQYFRKAIECDPSFALSHFTLAWMLEEEGKGNEAADEYRTAANLLPGSSWYQYMAGHALFFYQGKSKDAIYYLKAAVRLTPDYFEAHRDLGWVFFQAGDIDKAIRQYQEALRINPKSVEAHDCLGRTLLSRGDVDGAVAEFHAALAIDPTYGNAHYFLGEALAQQGKAVEGAAERAEAQRLWQAQSERR